MKSGRAELTHTETVSRGPQGKRFIKAVSRDRYLLLLTVPVIAYFLIFHYFPMYGLIIAFKDFTPGLGFFGSPGVGLKWFRQFIGGPYFLRIVRNTVLLSVYTIVFGFPLPIIFALFLNEVRSTPFKRTIQNFTYLPRFVSTVIIVGILMNMFSYPDGLVNRLLTLLSIEPNNFFINPKAFRALYVGSEVWQTFGWNSILYLAVLTSQNPELYESAKMDGANRFQQAVHISFPALKTTAVVLLILALGSLFSLGFEKVILMYNPATYKTADIISTYVYRKGILDFRFSFATAVGLLKSVISLILIVTANGVSKKVAGTGIW